jgi:hypothetical protein
MYRFHWVGPVPVWIYGRVYAGIEADVAHGIFPWGTQGDVHCGIYEWNGVREFAFGDAGAISLYPWCQAGVQAKLDILDAKFYPWMLAGASFRSARFISGALTCERKALSGELSIFSSVGGNTYKQTLSKWSSEARFPAIMSTLQ